MDNPDVLEKILMYTGLAGLVVFGLFTLFKEIIQKNIFSNMTKEQSYGIIRLIIRSSLFVAIVGIVAWGYTEVKKDEAYKNKALISKKIKGTIQTFNGDPIQSAKVSLLKDESIFHETDVDGNFVLEVSGTGNRTYDLVVSHPNYQTIKKTTEVDFTSTELAVDVNLLKLKPINTKIIPTSEPEIQDPAQRPTESGNPTQVASQNTANIVLYYDDEGTGCNLNVSITIGGKTYTPQSNPVELFDVPLGNQLYQVSGIGYCPGGQCNVTGQNQLQITAGGTYYMVFDSFYTCSAFIFDEQTYNSLKSLTY